MFGKQPGHYIYTHLVEFTSNLATGTHTKSSKNEQQKVCVHKAGGHSSVEKYIWSKNIGLPFFFALYLSNYFLCERLNQMRFGERYRLVARTDAVA